LPRQEKKRGSENKSPKESRSIVTTRVNEGYGAKRKTSEARGYKKRGKINEE